MDSRKCVFCHLGVSADQYNRGALLAAKFVHYASHFFEHFSEAKALSIIQAFSWHFAGKLLFPQNIEK